MASHRSRRRSPAATTLRVGAVAILLAGCAEAVATISGPGPTQSPRPTASATLTSPSTSPSPGTPTEPPVEVYAAAGVNAFAAEAKLAKSLVYVPNSVSDTVQVVDPATYRVIRTFSVPREPQHVVPSWDLKTLWVNSDIGNSLTPINPRTGRPGTSIHVEDPYNLYFAPDGSAAYVMAERLHRIDIRDPRTMALRREVPVPCSGINHADFTPDGSTFVASCEFSGKLIVLRAHDTKVLKVIDLNTTKTPGATSPHEAHAMGGVKGQLRAGASCMPQDVRLTPDGRWFLAADMLRNGIWVIDARTFTIARFIHTGMGAHGIYPSRDATRIFVSNRDAGTISVLDAATLAQVALWTIPGGGSPDMGGVSADGTKLWLSGRYSGVVYVFDTATGRVIHRVRAQVEPHGLAVWPQPGRFSLGHTGNMR